MPRYLLTGVKNSNYFMPKGTLSERGPGRKPNIKGSRGIGVQEYGGDLSLSPLGASRNADQFAHNGVNGSLHAVKDH
eukprot:9204478-Heterocapsa_arctica.AAC.1